MATLDDQTGGIVADMPGLNDPPVALVEEIEIVDTPEPPTKITNGKPAPKAEVAVVEDDAPAAAEWDHETIEFKDDTLQIRMPKQQALAAFSLSASKFVPGDVQNDIAGLFVSRHLSAESYSRVMSRLMDPDDAEYDEDTVADLMKAIVQVSVDNIEDTADKG